MRLVLVHFVAVVLAVFAVYFSYRAYRLFGSKTRKWFIFTVLAILLLGFSHLIEDFNEFIPGIMTGAQLELIEHLIFYGAMISFIISYHVMMESFKKSFPELMQSIK